MPKLKLTTKLLRHYDDNVERVGFVLADDKVIEVPNVHENPEKGFLVSDADILKYGDICVATWHTHPHASKNLSTVDMGTFLVWPDIDHYIVGNNGVQKYIIVDGDVLLG